MAIALVVVVLALLQLPARQLHLSSFWLEKELFAGGCVRAAAVLAGVKKAASAAAPANVYRFTPHHVHNEHCGCGHQHLPAPEQLQAGDDWRARAAIVLSMGMRPCSGRSWFCCSAR